MRQLRFLAFLSLALATTSARAQDSASPPSVQADSHVAAALRLLDAMGWAASLQAGESAYVATLVRAHPKLDDYRDILWDWANHTYDWGAIRTQLAKRLSSDLSQAELDSITTLYTASNRSKLEKTWSQELRVLTAYMAELETQLGTQYWPELRRKLRERATELHKADPLQSD